MRSSPNRLKVLLSCKTGFKNCCYGGGDELNSLRKASATASTIKVSLRGREGTIFVGFGGSTSKVASLSFYMISVSLSFSIITGSLAP